MARAGETSSGRSSPQAIEKRRVARELNTLLSEGGRSATDGRTAKRRIRLLKEIKEGRNGRPLKAIELLTRADELLTLGETVASIRKNGILLPKVALPSDAQDVVRRVQAAYDFHLDAWTLLGVSPQRLRARTKASGRNGKSKPRSGT